MYSVPVDCNLTGISSRNAAQPLLGFQPKYSKDSVRVSRRFFFASSTSSIEESQNSLRRVKEALRFFLNDRGSQCPSTSVQDGRLRASTVRQQRMANPTVSDDDDDDDVENAGAGITDKEWLKQKPLGFGHGKVYDTSLEEALLNEMESSKVALAESIAKKTGSLSRKAVKETNKAARESNVEGVEVWVGNLPRKKNVERDLWAAVKSVSGLLHIRPIVGGNEKTREPICKGFAFFTFASQADAECFTQSYNGETVRFGKVEKILACKLATLNSPHKPDLPKKKLVNIPKLAVQESIFPYPIVANVNRHADLLGSSNKQEIYLPAVSKIETPEDNGHLNLHDLEQAIWSELENEDDAKLDFELGVESDETELFLEEEDIKEDVLHVHMNKSLNVHLAGRNETAGSDLRLSSSIAPLQNSQGRHMQKEHEAEIQTVVEAEYVDLEDNVSSIRDNIPATFFEGTWEYEDEDEEESEDEDEEESVSFFFSSADEMEENSIFEPMQVYQQHPPDLGNLRDKERIRELESRVQDLQLKLQEKEMHPSTMNSLSIKEAEIEILERRVLAKARGAVLQEQVAGKSRKGKGRNKKVVDLKRKAPKAKAAGLGSASRLKKKERKIFTEALSKYSSVGK